MTKYWKLLVIVFIFEQYKSIEAGPPQQPVNISSTTSTTTALPTTTVIHHNKTIESRTCSTTEFKCGNGQCIPLRWQCDSEKDCSDNSDEDAKECQARVCGVDEFTCRGAAGECVPLTWMCDDNPDCSDGSDEKACSKGLKSAGLYVA